MVHDHFIQRWAERGVGGVDATELYEHLVRCIETGREEVTPVLRTKGGVLYRFFVRGESFYTVTRRNSVPRTVLTQAQFSKLRKAIKKRKQQSRGKNCHEWAMEEIEMDKAAEALANW